MLFMAVKTKTIEYDNHVKILEYTDKAGVFKVSFEFEKAIPIASARKIVPVVLGNPVKPIKTTNNKGSIIKV